MENSIEYFKKTIKQYLELDEEIKILEKAVKYPSEKKKSYQNVFYLLFKKKDISYVNLQEL